MPLNFPPRLLPAPLLAGALLLLAACSERTVVPGLSSDSAADPSPTPVASPTRIPPMATPGAGQVPPRPNPAQDVRNMPWNHDLSLYRSADGATFAEPAPFVERAGVPNVIRDASGRVVAVFQWFPFDNKEAFDRVAVAFSNDDGASWTKPEQIRVSGMPAGLQRPFDPTVVQLADGRYRLYFTSNALGPQGVPAIYSAISSDAVSYAFESDARFAPAAGTVDASVVFFEGAWHLFSHNQKANTGTGFHAVSDDGLTFTPLADVAAGTGRQWIGNAVVVAGVLKYYGSGSEGLWSATSQDGAAWTLDAPLGLRAGDPSAVVLASGEVLLVAVGPTRADAGPAPR